MILTLDVGNSQIYGGVFDDEKLIFTFRKSSKQNLSSDEIGIFLRSVVRENGISHNDITSIAICSVVPSIDYSLQNACKRYFLKDPFCVRPGSKTGLKIKYKNPLEVGADRITNAIAATKLFPNKNLMIIDFGTANTFCVIDKNQNYLGGVITPGPRISIEALAGQTAKLPIVEIKKTETVIGKSTVESIQAGIFYGNLDILKGFKERIVKEAFADEDVYVIGTGGFAKLYENENVFDELIPDLVLMGLNFAIRMNM